MDAGLEVTAFFEPDGTAYAFGTDAAVITVDTETGEVDLDRYVAVVDALAPFAIDHVDMPVTPPRMWQAMRGA